MTKATLQRLFSKTIWRGWLETLRQWEQAMDYDEVDLLESRVRKLEQQVSELRSKVGQA
ncbi:hypothetical protein ACO2RV_00545 [Ancylobacter sp. VNQ12]|uniref:hypothetical protein n=1 Tax=Ancylobacter sp. VNQ12 TaxID=3400920 RepID=UPI003C0B4385